MTEQLSRLSNRRRTRVAIALILSVLVAVLCAFALRGTF